MFAAALTLSAQTPSISPNGVVNAATMLADGGVAPGSVVTIFGANLSSIVAAAPTAPLPNNLGGVSVTIGSYSAPLFFVSPTQINLQVPWELDGTASASLVVTRDRIASAPYTVNLPATAPGIFQVLHADFTTVTNSSPANPGEIVIVLCTGLGPATIRPQSGAPADGNSPLAQTPLVTVGGSIASVAYSGFASGSVGFERVDFVVPQVLGAVSVSLTAGGIASNSVSMAVVQPANIPPPTTVAAVNGASFAVGGAVSPGAIVSIFGLNLGASVGKYLSTPISTTLQDVSVNFNGIPAPLFYVSPTQVNAQAPYSVQLGPANVSVTRHGNTSSAPVTLAKASPAIFTVGQNGSGPAIAFHSNGNFVSAAAPLVVGESLIAYGTGFGQLTTPLPDGTPSATLGSTQDRALASIDGLPANVTYYGTAAGLVGVNQVNMEVPGGLTAGNKGLTVTIDSITSPTVTLAVQASGGAINVRSASTIAGSTVNVPVSLTLGSDVSATSLSFTLMVTPGDGAPAIGSPLLFSSYFTPLPQQSASTSSIITVSGIPLSPLPTGDIQLGLVSFFVPRSAAATSYSVQITAAQASGGAPVNLTLGPKATISITRPPDGSLTLGSVSGTPGASVAVPVYLTLDPGKSLDSLAFGFRLNPVLNAPALGASMRFVIAPPLPPQSFQDVVYNAISLFFANISPPLAGRVHVGDVIVPIPAGALVGQSYTTTVSGASGSLGNNTAVTIGTEVPTTITVTRTYLVGDIFPSSADSAGNFGDGQVNTVDLNAVLLAVAGIPGYVPAACSDRFDAMDSYPTDTASQRGGDGQINVLDLIETLRRVSGVDNSKPTRMARGATCSTGPAAQARTRSVNELYFGEAQHLPDGVARFPVYFRANNAVSLMALSFGAGITGQGHSMKFVATGPAPSLQDNGVLGALAVAWLSPLPVNAGDTLLGYVDVTGANASTKLHFFGIDVTR